MGPEEPGAGSSALVIGSKRDRRTFCLGHLATAERTAAVVLPPDSETKFHEAVGLLEDWSPDPEDRGVEVSRGLRRMTDHRIGLGDPGAATEAGVFRDRKYPPSFRHGWTEDGSR